jgi:ATP-dependent Clp protease ATP-binding subunit ClpA
MFTASLERVLNVAAREALARRHADLTLEHLLFAAAHDPVGEEILTASGADVLRLKKELDQFLEETVRIVPAVGDLLEKGEVGMVGDLGHCLEEMEVNGRTFGEFALTLVLYDSERAALKRSVAECFKVFGVNDAHVIEERYNLLNAWLSVLPGNDAYNQNNQKTFVADVHCANPFAASYDRHIEVILSPPTIGPISEGSSPASF